MRQFARTQCLHLQRWAVTDVPSNGLQCKEKTFNPLSYCITLQQNAILYQYRIITPSWHKSKEAAENQCRVSSWLLAVWVIESYQIIFENAILILITILNAFFIATADAVSVAWISWPVEMLRAPISFKGKSGFTLGPYLPTFIINTTIINYTFNYTIRIYGFGDRNAEKMKNWWMLHQ